MSLAPRILAVAGLLAVPALLAVGSQALTRPADSPLEERQVVVIELAPPGAVDPDATDATEESDDPAEPAPTPPVESLAPPTPAPATSVPAPVPVPVPDPRTPADQGNPGLVEREVIDDDDDDDEGVDVDEDPGIPDGED
jgi:hypothetical protein